MVPPKTYQCILWTTINIFLNFRHVLTFNLETRLPVVKEGPTDSYFGYSVAQHQIKTDSRTENVLLIGAPRGSAPGYDHSGAVYRCNVTSYRGDCWRIEVDRDYVNKRSTIKDDEWLGVTVKSQGPGGYVMACAHRRIIAGSDFQWGQGICFSLSQDLEPRLPWIPCYNREVNKAHEQYGYCQAGTSGEIAEDNTIILGSPGPFTWRGSVFTNNIRFSMRDDKRWYFSPHQEENSPVNKYSYLGMSVTHGKFFGDKLSFVTGAPRSEGHGQVLFFSKRKNDATLEHELTLDGEQFASSFGYTLTSLDLNNDKHLDLVVGAPFYYEKGVGGAVYIYMNSAMRLNANTIPIKLVGKVESRFGFAIENAGDLNQDGYSDLAVGAPYEEGGGTVYIYLGSKNGIITTPAQEIHASDIPKTGRSLKTFGYSLDGGIDLDENSYPDLLIGDYVANTVVLLRSRPVIDIITSVSGQLENIDPDKVGCDEDRSSPSVCFSFDACFRFNSSAHELASSIKLEYKIEAETFTGKKYYRVRFKSSLNSDTPNIVQKIITVKGSSVTNDHCFNEIVYLKNKTDIQNPVQFKLSYSLIQKDQPLPKEGTYLPELYPILNQQEASKIFEAKFLKDCGLDEICNSDLNVELDILNLQKDELGRKYFLLGKELITLSVNVINTGEPAYDGMLYIIHPPQISYVGRKIVSGVQIQCLPVHRTVVTCELGNPFKESEIKLQVRFDSKNIQDEMKSLEFTVFANTTSHEKSPQDDVSVAVGIKKVAELEIRGTSHPQHTFYGGDASKIPLYEEDAGDEIFHIYEVINRGPWLASNFHVVVSWPSEIAYQNDDGQFILYLTENPEVNGNGYCTVRPNHINPLNLKRQPQELRLSPENYVFKTRRKRQVVPQELKIDGKVAKAVTLDCNDHSAMCFEFNCTFRSLDRDSTAVIKIRSRLWNSTLVHHYPDVDYVSIISRARISVLPYDIQQNEDDDFTMAETRAYPDISLHPKSEGIPLWIIILSACIGILLLVLLIVVLYKCGFFKRKKPGYEPAPVNDYL